MNRYIHAFVLFFCTCMTWLPHVCYSASIETTKSENDFRFVAKKAIPAVVSIKVKSDGNQKGRSSMGDQFDFFGDDFFQQFFFSPNTPSKKDEVTGQASGFLVSPEGYIITNSHVVTDSKEIKVTLTDEREFTAKLVGHDPSTDIALIKIDAKNLPYLQFGNSDDLEIGQWVVAIGNPLGLQASLTVGVVSAKGRNNLDIARIEDFIQTDAAINRGNSGGPLLNLNGDVVGVNTAMVTNMANGGYMGIGFAIPSMIVKHDMEELIQSGTVSRGFIGVTIQQVDQDLAAAFGLEKIEGALVAEVSKDSPAEKAGIKQGDVILKLNGHPVLNTAFLRNTISLMKPGTKVELAIMHKDKTMKNVSLEVGNFPTQVAQSEIKDSKLGIDVQTLTPELARSLNYKDSVGVVINKVKPGSVAAWAGIKKGAIIIAVNHQQISSVDQFQNALDATEKNKPILLLIKQDEMTRFVSLKIG